MKVFVGGVLLALGLYFVPLMLVQSVAPPDSREFFTGAAYGVLLGLFLGWTAAWNHHRFSGRQQEQ
jgi:NhaP-type Na+/H+ or K+/H+ antiporter